MAGGDGLSRGCRRGGCAGRGDFRELLSEVGQQVIPGLLRTFPARALNGERKLVVDLRGSPVVGVDLMENLPLAEHDYGEDGW